MTLLHGGKDFMVLVTQYYLALKGTGLMLSPKESDLVMKWKRSGAPVDLVCRAIRDSLESFRRSERNRCAAFPGLAYCVPAVDEAIKSWKFRMAGHNCQPNSTDEGR